MEHDTAMTWPEQLPDETLMAAANEDDFSNFLEFGIDFADLDGHNAAAAVQHQQAMQHANHHIATSLADEARVAATSQAPQYQSMMGEHMAIGIPSNGPVDESPFHFPQEQQQQVFHQQQLSQHPDKLVHQHQHQHPHQQMGTHRYQDGQHMIPPTPNSVELHGGAARYMQRVDQSNDLYERYGQMSDEQAAAFYTPLVSPAMTPLETQFRLPEYTIPGEYFTPLTSPALEAQNSNSNAYPFTTQPQPQHNAGYAPSPVDTNGLTMTSAPPSPAVFKKQRQTRRPSTATRTGGRAAKASPSIQAKTWRKSTRNSHLVADDLAAKNIPTQEQGSNRPLNNAHSSLRYSSNESSQDSVSPEPISEPLMPPPALPHKSPAIVPQFSESNSSAPATPATLMRITNRPQHTQDPSGQFTGQASLVTSELQDEAMEDVVLPEAATEIRPRPSRINTTIIATKDQDKSATNTPTMGPQSASSRRPSGSLTPGLYPGAMPSPSGPVPKKSDSKTPTTRKRQSVTSSHASPALRPRISPSIQPLVRGDGLTSESSALYLASKSNYQHILDGTVLPGVSYPEALAENLSSKRTNHKLAEQGRRNRINTALKEIELLLPPGFAQERAIKESKEANALAKNGDKDKDKEKNTPATISKASTVEMAIDYIKALKQELEETKAQLKRAETKLSGQSDPTSSGDDIITADNETVEAS